MRKVFRFLSRFFCRHRSLKVAASTVAEPHTPLNVIVGVTVRCERCGRQWVDDVVAGCQKAWTTAECREACKAALYLMGNDADRRMIGEKPWGNRGAETVPDMLRAALDKAESR
jgi:hypothetical protein